MAEMEAECGVAAASSYPVTVTEVFSPNTIWAVPSDFSGSRNRFLEIKQQMVEYCARHRHRMKLEGRAELSLVYAYQSPNTDRWYRVRLLARFQRSDGNACKVRLLDEGVVETVLERDLYVLVEPYCDLNQLPARALRIRLSGVVPIALTWAFDQHANMKCDMTRAPRWSEAACQYVTRQLSSGSPGLLTPTRTDGSGTVHGRLRLLDAGSGDLGQQLVTETLAWWRPEDEASSSEEEECETVPEASLRQREARDSDDPPGREQPPLTSDHNTAKRPIISEIKEVMRKKQEEFRQLVDEEQMVDLDREQESGALRSRLQRHLEGALLDGVPSPAAAAVGVGRGGTGHLRADPAPVGRGHSPVKADLSPVGRGQGALTPTGSLGSHVKGLSPGGGESVASPAVASPPSGSAAEEAAGGTARDGCQSDHPSPGSLAEALSQLRQSELSSADEAAHHPLVPAGQTPTARYQLALLHPNKGRRRNNAPVRSHAARSSVSPREGGYTSGERECLRSGGAGRGSGVCDPQAVSPTGSAPNQPTWREGRGSVTEQRSSPTKPDVYSSTGDPRGTGVVNPTETRPELSTTSPFQRSSALSQPESSVHSAAGIQVAQGGLPPTSAPSSNGAQLPSSERSPSGTLNGRSPTGAEPSHGSQSPSSGRPQTGDQQQHHVRSPRGAQSHHTGPSSSDLRPPNSGRSCSPTGAQTQDSVRPPYSGRPPYRGLSPTNTRPPHGGTQVRSPSSTQARSPSSTQARSPASTQVRSPTGAQPGLTSQTRTPPFSATRPLRQQGKPPPTSGEATTSLVACPTAVSVKPPASQQRSPTAAPQAVSKQTPPRAGGTGGRRCGEFERVLNWRERLLGVKPATSDSSAASPSSTSSTRSVAAGPSADNVSQEEVVTTAAPGQKNMSALQTAVVGENPADRAETQYSRKPESHAQPPVSPKEPRSTSEEHPRSNPVASARQSGPDTRASQPTSGAPSVSAPVTGAPRSTASCRGDEKAAGAAAVASAGFSTSTAINTAAAPPPDGQRRDERLEKMRQLLQRNTAAKRQSEAPLRPSSDVVDSPKPVWAAPVPSLDNTAVASTQAATPTVSSPPRGTETAHTPAQPLSPDAKALKKILERMTPSSPPSGETAPCSASVHAAVGNASAGNTAIEPQVSEWSTPLFQSKAEVAAHPTHGPTSVATSRVREAIVPFTETEFLAKTPSTGSVTSLAQEKEKASEQTPNTSQSSTPSLRVRLQRLLEQNRRRAQTHNPPEPVISASTEPSSVKAVAPVSATSPSAGCDAQSPPAGAVPASDVPAALSAASPEPALSVKQSAAILSKIRTVAAERAEVASTAPGAESVQTVGFSVAAPGVEVSRAWKEDSVAEVGMTLQCAGGADAIVVTTPREEWPDSEVTGGVDASVHGPGVTRQPAATADTGLMTRDGANGDADQPTGEEAPSGKESQSLIEPERTSANTEKLASAVKECSVTPERLPCMPLLPVLERNVNQLFSAVEPVAGSLPNYRGAGNTSADAADSWDDTSTRSSRTHWKPPDADPEMVGSGEVGASEYRVGVAEVSGVPAVPTPDGVEGREAVPQGVTELPVSVGTRDVSAAESVLATRDASVASGDGGEADGKTTGVNTLLGERQSGVDYAPSMPPFASGESVVSENKWTAGEATGLSSVKPQAGTADPYDSWDEAEMPVASSERPAVSVSAASVAVVSPETEAASGSREERAGRTAGMTQVGTDDVSQEKAGTGPVAEKMDCRVNSCLDNSRMVSVDSEWDVVPDRPKSDTSADRPGSDTKVLAADWGPRRPEEKTPRSKDSDAEPAGKLLETDKSDKYPPISDARASEETVSAPSAAATATPTEKTGVGAPDTKTATANLTAAPRHGAQKPGGLDWELQELAEDLLSGGDLRLPAAAAPAAPSVPSPTSSAPAAPALTSAGFSERARPASDGGAPADSARLRVLVNGRRRLAPWWRADQMTFQDMLLRRLRALGMLPSRAQAHLWPAAARYRSAVCVSHHGSGKTLGWILAVLDSLLDNQVYTGLPAGHGPLCLVLVPGWRRARAVHQLCLELADPLRCRSVLLHGGGAEAEQEVALMNGCDLVVGTPACMLRLRERGGDTFLQLKRVCHLVLDDADLLVESFTAQVVRLVLAVHECWRRRSGPEVGLPQQMLVMSRHWTPGLRSVTTHLSDPVVITACYVEQMVWARPRVFTHMLEETEKDDKLLGLLEAGAHRDRLVVFTSSDQSAQRLARLLRTRSCSVLLADGDQLGASLTELERCWRSAGSDSDVLVVSDSVAGELSVRDARVLVHYDVPTQKKTQLGLRMSYLMDNYADMLTQPNQQSGCVAHLFVCPAAAALIGRRLEQLLRRLGAAVPDALAEAARQQRRAGGGGRQLCPQLLSRGECGDRLSCENRHWLHPKMDAPDLDLPHWGEVTVSVTHVEDAATVCARLMSVRERDPVTGCTSSRELDGLAAALELDVCAHYSDPANRTCHQLPQLGDLCGVEWRGSYARARVAALDTAPSTCRVLLIDFGNVETLQRSGLLSLPPSLASPPPLAVTAHLCDVRPVDGDPEWTEGASKLTSGSLLHGTAIGKIVLALGRRLWLSPLVRRRRHQLYRTSTTLLDTSAARQLTERGFGEPNPAHLQRLHQLCRRGGLPVRPEWLPADHRQPYAATVLPLVAPLLNNSSVLVTSVVSPGELHVQRNDVFPQYEALMAELQQWAAGPEPRRLPPLRYSVQQHCTAKFPADGRWYRAQVLAVNRAPPGGDAEQADRLSYTVRYTDVGDTDTVPEQEVLPLPERFARRLPLQAIRCELAFCDPPGEEGDWPEQSGETLYDLSLDQEELWLAFHCQVVDRGAGGHQVRLFDAQRRSVAQLLAEAGLARLDHVGLLGVAPPEFPVVPSPLDSDDSEDPDSDSALRPVPESESPSALRRAAKTLYQVAPKEDGVPVHHYGEFEVVGFPFSRFAREEARPSSSGQDSIEVIDPAECYSAPSSGKSPGPVQITELTGRGGAGDGLDSDDDSDWEKIGPAQPSSAPPPAVSLPPPLVFSPAAPPAALRTRIPRVTWWQDGAHVRLTVHLSDVRRPQVDIKPDRFSFRTEQGDCVFEVAIHLFSTIVPEDSSYQLLGAHVLVKLRKQKALSWRRLTREQLRAHWLQHDLEHLGGDGSSSEDDCQFRVPDSPSRRPPPVVTSGVPSRPAPPPEMGPSHQLSESSSDEAHDDLGPDPTLDPETVREMLQPDPWAAGDGP